MKTPAEIEHLDPFNFRVDYICECKHKVPFLDFYRMRFCDWQHALSLNNGIVDHAADQMNYREAANELYARERRRQGVGGSVEWKVFTEQYEDCVDRDRMYTWLAKHAQRAAIFDRRTLNPPSSVDTSLNSS